MFDYSLSDTVDQRPLGLLLRAPMLCVALGLMAGVVLGERVVPLPMWVLCTSVVLCLALGVVTMPIRGSRVLFWISLWSAFVFMGWTLYEVHRPADPFPTLERMPDSVITLRLTDTPVATPKCYKVAAQIDSINGQVARGKMMLFVRQDEASSGLRYGDRIRIHAAPQRPSRSVGDDGFDYRKYLFRHGITWQCFVEQGRWVRLPGSDSFSLVRCAKQLQLRLVSQIQAMPLSHSQRGIAEAILLGWRGDLGDATMQQYRDAGVMHLLCVSGLHVGLMAGMVGICLFFLWPWPLRRFVKWPLQIVAIWLFVLVSGMPLSAVRAGVMFTLMLVAKIVGRSSSSVNNLATAAVLLLFVDPMVLFDVGFQLSYLAVLGILLWYRPLCMLLPRLYSHPTGWLWIPLQKLWGWTCLSTSAQLAVLPLLLYYFHQLPLYFLVANLTVVPFAGVLLVSIMAMLVCGGWTVMVPLVSLELNVVDGITRWVGLLPYATLDGLYCDGPMAVLLFASWCLFTLYLRQRRYWALPAGVGCLLLTVLHGYGHLFA